MRELLEQYFEYLWRIFTLNQDMKRIEPPPNKSLLTFATKIKEKMHSAITDTIIKKIKPNITFPNKL